MTFTTIALIDQTLAFSTEPPNPAFVGGSYVPSAVSSAELSASFAVDESSSSVCTIAEGSVSFDAAGACTVIASQSGTADVRAATPISQTFDVTRRAQTVLLALADVTITATPITLPADVDGRTLTYVAGPSEVCSVVGNSLTLNGPGTCEVTATQAGTAVYLPLEVSDTFVVSSTPSTPSTPPRPITRTEQSLTLPALGGTYESGQQLALPTTTAQGLPVVYTAGPSSVCSISSGSLVIVGSGECTVTATQAGDATRAPFSSTTRFAVAVGAGVDEEVEGGPTLSVVADRSGAAGTVAIQGAGLLPGSVVTIEVDGSPMGTVVVTVSADGTYRVTFELPEGLAPGVHTVKVSATGSDGTTVTRQQEMFVDWKGSLSSGAGGGYEAIEATRVLDTREVAGRLVANTEYRVDVPEGLVGDDVTALTVDLTVVKPVAPGYITVYPCASPRPVTSATNFAAGQTRSNLVDVPFESGAAVCLWSPVATDAIVDVQGFHAPSNVGRLVARTASRVLDTRSGAGIRAGETRAVKVVGNGMASSSVTVAALNIAATQTRGTGFLTVFPCGDDRPLASNLNFVADQAVSNEVLVEPGDNGTVCIYSSGDTHIVVDLNATFEASGSLDFESFVTERIADTRSGTRLAAGETREWRIAHGVTAVALNVAATQTQGAGFLTVFACNTRRPLASNVNFHTHNQTASNHVTVPVDDAGKVCVYSSTSTHVVIDIEGVYHNIDN